jgi:hypothetical protein
MTAEPAEAPAAVAATETAETPPPAAEPKKPARKKVAQKQQPQNFFDFFTGGRSWDNRSYNNNRSARASDRNGFRPFF